MRYTLRVRRSAEKELDRLPESIHERLSRRILGLEDNPRPQGAKKLSNREEYRLRVGQYRVLYTIDDEHKIVEIVAVGHRREVYR
ncbi:MAG: type II toxin-antitoxin system RelE/ParE family toxin [Nitrospirota bacterium]